MSSYRTLRLKRKTGLRRRSWSLNHGPIASMCWKILWDYSILKNTRKWRLNFLLILGKTCRRSLRRQMSLWFSNQCSQILQNSKFRRKDWLTNWRNVSSPIEFNCLASFPSHKLKAAIPWEDLQRLHQNRLRTEISTIQNKNNRPARSKNDRIINV